MAVSFRGHVSWLGAGSTSLTRNLLGRHKVQVDKNKIAAMTTEMKATKGMVATMKIFNVFFSKRLDPAPGRLKGKLVPPYVTPPERWHITKQGSWLRSHECTWEE